MTFEFPESVNILGRTYRVKDVPSVAGAEGVIGMAAYHEGTIYVDHNVDPPLILTTLWHELIHIGQHDLQGYPDEQQARWISLFVHNILISNPGILHAYLDLLADSMDIRTPSPDKPKPSRGRKRTA